MTSVASEGQNNTYKFLYMSSWILHITSHIGEYEFVDDHKSGEIILEFNGRLNKWGVISLRFDVKVKKLSPGPQGSFPYTLVWLHAYIALTTSASTVDHDS
uniref:Small ribosomal subunit protein uS8c n=1 Tax=Oryza punctata TaxID=4537 RepID=A0A0E0JE64_ORYPU